MGIPLGSANLPDLVGFHGSPFESVALSDCGLVSRTVAGVDSSRRPLLVQANWRGR